MNQALYQATIHTPLGEMTAVDSDAGLCLLEFSDRLNLPHKIAQLEQAAGMQIQTRSTPLIQRVQEQLNQYFAGERRVFELPFTFTSTEFNLQVWQQLSRIPYGETRTYQQIAVELHRPLAARAVGRANGANPLAIVIPCHRLVGADGSLTGYGGGLERKLALLELEKRNRM